MATIQEIKSNAALVKNATGIGENTAERVGGVLTDMTDYLYEKKDELGTDGNAVMSQQAVTEAITNTINLTDIDFDEGLIAQIMFAKSSCRFLVTSNSSTMEDVSVGILDCFSDNMAHMLTQVFTTHYTLPLDGSHTDDKIYKYWRSYHFQGGTSSIPTGTWGEWTLLLEPLTDSDIDEIIPVNTSDNEDDEGGGEDEGGIDNEMIEAIMAKVDQNTTDIASMQENGIKSTGNYILINVDDRSSSDDPRNARVVSQSELSAIKDYIDKLERKYPTQYQFNGSFVVREYISLTGYLDVIYDKMRIYHVDTYYKMTLSTQEINMDRSAETGKGRMIIKGIEFAFDASDIPSEMTTYVKEVQWDVISVPEQVLSDSGDMKYKNVYKVLTNDGTYKEVSELLGVNIETDGNGDKFLADNGEYIAMELPTYTLTVTAVPEDAVIKLNGTEQSSISVKKGTEVTIEVSLRGYYTITEKVVINEDITKEITLEQLPELPTTNREELEDMNVYKVWAMPDSGKAKFDTTSTATIKAYLDDINAGNLALLYMTQPISDEPKIKDYIQMSVISYNATGFTAIGIYQSDEFVGVGSLSQYFISVKSNGSDGYTATYSLLTVSLGDLNFNAAFNLPRQYRTGISYSGGTYRLSNIDKNDINKFLSEYNNLEEPIPKGRVYLTITTINDVDGSPTEVPFDIYPDVYNKSNIGGSGVVLHGVSRNADTQGRRLELEISGSTESLGYSITKCQYV